ncbi:MAG: TIGR02677 family protein [Desulfitobacteriaceae bacterium]|nr:TIGR02677 family protein [Desulfitobacteriaceae bacterium]
MDEQLLKPIPEASYLVAANAWRYRAILRYFYLQHEKLRYYLFPEEIYEHLTSKHYFTDYTEEQLEQDLNRLVEWKNLIPRQDAGKVTTIQEFKKKKFRYQCTPYTVEFERMIQELEQKGDSFGGSLEKNLFDRLLELLSVLQDIKLDAAEPESVYAIWDELFGYFKKLTENASDYLAHLESEKIEEMVVTEAFLVYKDAVTEYLRNFMTALQRTSLKIEGSLKAISDEQMQAISQVLARHYLSIPRLDKTFTAEELVTSYLNQWDGLHAWFLGQGGRDSDLIYLQDTTNETVRRMTRFAQRLGEKHHNFKSRKKDYQHLAHIFASCSDLKEAQKLSACVFGLFHTRHLWALEKETEDIYQEIWDIAPSEAILKPRVRTYREKTKPQAVVSFPEEKAKTLKEYLLEKEAEQRLINSIVENKRIVLKKVVMSDPYLRKTLLDWISKSLGNKDGLAKTQTGHKFRLSKIDEQMVTMYWDDGILKIPNFVIELL